MALGRAESIRAHRALATLLVSAALLDLAEAIVTDDGAGDIVGEELLAIGVAAALAIEDAVAAITEGARATLEVGVALAHVDAADAHVTELTCGAIHIAHAVDIVWQTLAEVIAAALSVGTADLAALAICARRALALEALAAIAIIGAIAIIIASAITAIRQACPVDAGFALGAIHVRDANILGGAFPIDARFTRVAIRVGGAKLWRLLVLAGAIQANLALAALAIAGADIRRRAIVGDTGRTRAAIRIGLTPIIERGSATTAEE